MDHQEKDNNTARQDSPAGDGGAPPESGGEPQNEAGLPGGGESAAKPKEGGKSKKKTPAAETPETRLAELNEKFLRVAAEYDNYRKRTEREKQASAAFGMAAGLEALLPSLDALEAAAAAESADAEYKKGVEMTLSMFRSALAALGVEEIEAAGKPFDPALHCAVLRETVESAESGSVVAVLQKGYRLGDRILRHSMVSVAE